MPARKQRLPDVSLLLGSHLFPNALPVAQSLLLARSQAVPGLKTLANLVLLFRRQAQKTLIIPQKLFLACWRHILEPLNRPGRQIVGIPPGRQSIRRLGPGPYLLPGGGARLCVALLLGRLVEFLPRR